MCRISETTHEWNDQCLPQTLCQWLGLSPDGTGSRAEASLAPGSKLNVFLIVVVVILVLVIVGLVVYYRGLKLSFMGTTTQSTVGFSQHNNINDKF